jgi:hypothetical protein
MLNKVAIDKMQTINDVFDAQMESAEQVFNIADIALKDAEFKRASAADLIDEALKEWHDNLRGVIFDPMQTGNRLEIFLDAQRQHKNASEQLKSASEYREAKRLNLLEANYNVRQIKERLNFAKRILARKREER